MVHHGAQQVGTGDDAHTLPQAVGDDDGRVARGGLFDQAAEHAGVGHQLGICRHSAMRLFVGRKWRHQRMRLQQIQTRHAGNKAGHVGVGG